MGVFSFVKLVIVLGYLKYLIEAVQVVWFAPVTRLENEVGASLPCMLELFIDFIFL
jgi:hypothetical protein